MNIGTPESSPPELEQRPVPREVLAAIEDFTGRSADGLTFMQGPGGHEGLRSLSVFEGGEVSVARSREGVTVREYDLQGTYELVARYSVNPLRPEEVRRAKLTVNGREIEHWAERDEDGAVQPKGVVQQGRTLFSAPLEMPVAPGVELPAWVSESLVEANNAVPWPEPLPWPKLELDA